MTEIPWSALISALALGVTLLVGGVRYVIRIERGFNEQALINQKTVGALDVIVERLNGRTMLNTQVQDDMERRLDTLEARVAPFGPRV